MDDKWVHEVIEGRDVIVRRILSVKDPHVLATKHSNRRVGELKIITYYKQYSETEEELNSYTITIHIYVCLNVK
jgi:hypothetical protein